MSRMHNNISVGSYVFYKKRQSIGKILEIDSFSKSYTIECDGRIIDTDDDFLDFDLVNKCVMSEELEIYNKQLQRERDEWKIYAEKIEKDLDILNTKYEKLLNKDKPTSESKLPRPFQSHSSLPPRKSEKSHPPYTTSGFSNSISSQAPNTYTFGRSTFPEFSRYPHSSFSFGSPYPVTSGFQPQNSWSFGGSPFNIV